MKRLAKTGAAACVLLAASGYHGGGSAQSADADAISPIEISGSVGLVSDRNATYSAESAAARTVS